MQNDQEIDKLLDNLEFNAITDGLGFHHSVREKKEVQKSLSQKANDLDIALKKHLNDLKSNSKDESSLNRGDLSPFYQDEVEEKPIESLQDLILDKTEEKITNASSGERVVAYLLDLTLVTSMAFLTMILAFTMSSIPISSEGTALFGVLVVLFYLLYFSILDATNHSTVGKRIMAIRLVKNKKPPGLMLSFFRSLFCLGSFLLIGLPCLLKTQDLFFNTQVIKK